MSFSIAVFLQYYFLPIFLELKEGRKRHGSCEVESPTQRPLFPICLTGDSKIVYSGPFWFLRVLEFVDCR